MSDDQHDPEARNGTIREPTRPAWFRSANDVEKVEQAALRKDVARALFDTLSGRSMKDEDPCSG
jgi:hypothetical protein